MSDVVLSLILGKSSCQRSTLNAQRSTHGSFSVFTAVIVLFIEVQCFLSSEFCLAESGVVDSKVIAELKLSKVGDSIAIHADLLDGFSYRFPFAISTDSVEIDCQNLTADAVCNCVQIRFAENSLSSKSSATGQIFLRPKSGSLVDGVRIRGLGLNAKVGEADNTLCSLMLKVKVSSPVTIPERSLLVEDGKLQVYEVPLQVVDGVAVKSLSIECSEAGLEATANSDFSKLLLRQTMPLKDGRIYLNFELEYQGVLGKFTPEIDFGPRLKTRVIPSTLIFKKDEEKPTQKCLLISSELLKGDLEDVDCFVRATGALEWSLAKMTPTFGQTNAQKGVMRLVMEDKETFEKIDSWSIRIIARSCPQTFVDVDCKWTESAP